MRTVTSSHDNRRRPWPGGSWIDPHYREDDLLAVPILGLRSLPEKPLVETSAASEEAFAEGLEQITDAMDARGHYLSDRWLHEPLSLSPDDEDEEEQQLESSSTRERSPVTWAADQRSLPESSLLTPPLTNCKNYCQ